MKKLILALSLFLVGCVTAPPPVVEEVWKGNETATQYIVDEEYPDSIMGFIDYLNPMGSVLTLNEIEEKAPEDIIKLVKECAPTPPAGLFFHPQRGVIVICQYVVEESLMRGSDSARIMHMLGWEYKGKKGVLHIFVRTVKNLTSVYYSTSDA